MSRFEGPRGLIGYARIETAEQQTVEVQQSSAVLSMTINGEVKGPFVWLRVERSEVGAFAHLAVDDARELRDALSAWLADFGGEQVAREPKVEIVREEGQPARCKVWRDGVLLFDGRDYSADLTDREPSTDEAVVVARVIRDHDEESLTCYDHDGTCCPCGKHDMSHAEWELHRARAALLAAQQVRRG